MAQITWFLLPQVSASGCVTAATELGIKAFTNAVGNCGWEISHSATVVTQVVLALSGTNAIINMRKTSNNGGAWTAWSNDCNSLNTFWG